MTGPTIPDPGRKRPAESSDRFVFSEHLMRPGRATELDSEDAAHAVRCCSIPALSARSDIVDDSSSRNAC